MKFLSLVILVFALISCKTRLDKEKSQEAYLKGIKILQQEDSISLNKYSKALSAFNFSINLNPKNIESIFWKSQCEIHLGQLNEAFLTSKSAINEFKREDQKLIPLFYVTAGLVEKIN